MSGKKWGGGWCPGTESNCPHGDFQSPALPTELPGHQTGGILAKKGSMSRKKIKKIQKP